MNLKKKNIRIILMTTKQFNFEQYKKHDLKRLNEYCDIIREIAKEEKLELVDIFKEYGKYPDKSLLLTGDRLHPNNHGHRLVANLLMKQIIKAYRKK